MREGLTQEVLAKRIGADRTYINKIERGTIGLPQYETRQKLGAVLGFNEDDLVSADILELGASQGDETDLVRVPSEVGRALMALAERPSGTAGVRFQLSLMESIAPIAKALASWPEPDRWLLAKVVTALSNRPQAATQALIAAGELTADELEAAGVAGVVEREADPYASRVCGALEELGTLRQDEADVLLRMIAIMRQERRGKR